jgi:hypothetical protein
MGLQRIQPIDSPWHIEMGEAKKVFSCSIGASNLPFFLGGWLCRSWTRCQTFSSSFWSSSSWLVLKKKRPMVKQLELLLLQPPERRDWIGTINPRSSRDLHLRGHQVLFLWLDICLKKEDINSWKRHSKNLWYAFSYFTPQFSKPSPGILLAKSVSPEA